MVKFINIFFGRLWSLVNMMYVKSRRIREMIDIMDLIKVNSCKDVGVVLVIFFC